MLGRVVLLVTLLQLLSLFAPGAGSGRRRRYLTFPYGTTLKANVAIKFPATFSTQPTPIFSESVVWGVSYDLPNGTQLLVPAGEQRRRQRRDLYRRLELALDSMQAKAVRVVLGAVALVVMSELCEAGRLLSRQRRYLVFPEGSTFNAALCMSNKALIPGDTAIWTEGVAWGLSYDLPNNTQAVASVGAGAAEQPPLDGRRRRDRRDLFRKIEIAVESTGMDGRACVLRALCEGQQLLAPRSNILHELLRVILAVPMGRVSQRDPYEISEYVSARHHGVSGLDCATLYADCPVSLISLLLSLTPVKSLHL